MPPQICAFARIPSDFDNSPDFAWSRLLRDQEDSGSNPLAPANPFGSGPETWVTLRTSYWNSNLWSVSSWYKARSSRTDQDGKRESCASAKTLGDFGSTLQRCLLRNSLILRSLMIFGRDSPLRLFSGVSSASVEARRFDGAWPSFPVGGQHVNR